jgi:hypothetical protein
MGDLRNTYKILVGKYDRRDHLEDLHVRWENIRMDLKEIRLEGVDWMNLAQDRTSGRLL